MSTFAWTLATSAAVWWLLFFVIPIALMLGIGAWERRCDRQQREALQDVAERRRARGWIA